jgi:hypothetical protein
MLLRDHSYDLVWYDTLIGIRAQRRPVGSRSLESSTRRQSPRRYSERCDANVRPVTEADRAFTSYFENSRRIVLHFQHFRCDGRPLCTKGGCLQQIYMLTGGHYRLLKSYYGPAGE